MSSVYKHILFVTDLQEDGKYVANKAKQIIQANERSKLTVLNIVLDNIIAGGYEIMPIFNYSEEQVELSEHKSKLNKFIKEAGFVTAECEVVEALSTSSGINDYAVQNSVDLIIIGKHERKGFFENLIGDTSASILSYAPCDVLVIKIPQEITEAAAKSSDKQTT